MRFLGPAKEQRATIAIIQVHDNNEGRRKREHKKSRQHHENLENNCTEPLTRETYELEAITSARGGRVKRWPSQCWSVDKGSERGYGCFFFFILPQMQGCLRSSFHHDHTRFFLFPCSVSLAWSRARDEAVCVCVCA